MSANNNEAQQTKLICICQYCSKLFRHKKSCIRHENACTFNQTRATALLCPNCSASFIRQDNLKGHLKRCPMIHTKISKIAKTPCIIKNCKFQFLHRWRLIEHLRVFHKDFNVEDPITKKFQTFEEFIEWKGCEEKRTFSYFSLKTGQGKNKSCFHYYCQHDGPARESPKTNRRSLKGQIKRGLVCIAKMKVQQHENKTVTLEYFPTHTHPCSPEDAVHHPMARDLSAFINEQISQQVSPSDILNKVTATHLGKSIKDLSYTKRLIRERARKRQIKLGLNKEDSKAECRDLPIAKEGEFDIYSLNEDPCEITVEVETQEESSASVEKYKSMVSRVESNLSEINNFLSSARQNNVSERVLSYVDGVLSDLVVSLQTQKTDHDYVLELGPNMPILNFNNEETSIAELSLPIFTVPKAKTKSLPEQINQIQRKKKVKQIYTYILNVGQQSTVTFSNEKHSESASILLESHDHFS